LVTVGVAQPLFTATGGPDKVALNAKTSPRIFGRPQFELLERGANRTLTGCREKEYLILRLVA
jgi:hypothetical protein